MLDLGPPHVCAAQGCGDGHTNKKNLIRQHVFSKLVGIRLNETLDKYL